jgi:WD40 repeat protein
LLQIYIFGIYFNMQKQLEIRQHAHGIFDLAMPNQGEVFTCSGDGYVVLWDLYTGKQNPFAVKTSVPAYALACSENLLFIGLNNGDLHWVDLQTKQEVKFFQQHRSAIFRLVYEPKLNLLVSSDADGFVGIWDTKSTKLNMIFQLPTGKIRAVAFDNDAKTLALGGQDGYVHVLETEYFNELHKFYAHKDGVTSLAFHPNGKALITGGKDAYLRIWNRSDYSKVKAFPAHLYAIYRIIFSPEAHHFATCSRDKTIKIWNSDDFTVQQKLDIKSGGHQHSVNAIHWSETGLLSVSDDRRLILWK